MLSLEMTGKTVEEAVAAALAQLGLDRDAVEVEVIEEGKKGMFGLFSKPAKVLVKEKIQNSEIGNRNEELEFRAPSPEPQAPITEEKAEIEEKAVAVAAAVAEVTEAAEASLSPEPSAPSHSNGERPRRRRDREDRRRGGRRRNEVREEEAAPEGEEIKSTIKDNVEAQQAAKQFLTDVFAAMKMNVVIEKFYNKSDDSLTFRLHGPGMGVLIGKHGQTLDSLQYLTNLVANKHSVEKVRVNVDAEQYRERRRETIVRLARSLAEKVKQSGEKIELEPMTPYERKIIHMTLQNDPVVTTYSEGEEPYRKTIIDLK